MYLSRTDLNYYTVFKQLVKHRYKPSKMDPGSEQLICQKLSMSAVPKDVYKQWRKYQRMHLLLSIVVHYTSGTGVEERTLVLKH